MDSLSSFLNVKEISSYLSLRASTIYSMVEERRIPHYRIGRKIRFKKSVIDQWMEQQKQEVVEIRVEARKILGSIKKKGGLDLDKIVKNSIDEAKGRGYNFPQEKPDGIEGLETEVKHGLV